MPHPQIRTVTGNRYRRRLFSACHRHPTEPVTGFCALCLRDRLAGLDSSSGQIEAEKVVACSRRTRGHGVAAFSSVPELRRSKSVAAGKCDVLNDLAADPRRKSCDVRARSTLSDLFVGDDADKARDGGKWFQSVNLAFSTVAEPVVETKEDEEGDIVDGDEIRVLGDAFVGNEVQDEDDDEIRVSDDVITGNEIDDDDEIEEGDLKTMKEIIDIELDNKRRNFWDAASVFSQKWRKWRHKQKEKKQSRPINAINGGTDINRSKLGQYEVEDDRFGRRSCDTEPRFSIDAHRLSVEDSRFSFDEHRASWDGYMIARTIPRLTPMLSVVDNTMLTPVNRGMNTTMENLQMHSISEDGVGSSGGSGQSGSDTSASIRGSSSSSMKSSSTKTAGSVGDDVKPASNARVSPANDVIFQGTKLVITEKELKDWHLNSIKNNNVTESVSNAPNSISKTIMTNPSNAHKIVTSSRWKKVCNLWGHKHKHDDKIGVKNVDKKNVEDIPETRTEIWNSSLNLLRNPSLVNSRNRNTRYSTSDLDSGLLRLYLTPFRNSRRNKSGRNRGPSMVINGLQPN